MIVTLPIDSMLDILFKKECWAHEKQILVHVLNVVYCLTVFV